MARATAALVFVLSALSLPAGAHDPTPFDVAEVDVPAVTRIAWPAAAIDNARIHVPEGTEAVVAAAAADGMPTVVSWYRSSDGRLLAAVEVHSASTADATADGLRVSAFGDTPGRAPGLVRARSARMRGTLEPGVDSVVLQPAVSKGGTILAPLLTSGDEGELIALGSNRSSELWRHDGYRVEIRDGDGRRRFRATLPVIERVAPVALGAPATSPNVPTEVVISNASSPSTATATIVELAPVPPLRWTSPPADPAENVIVTVLAGATVQVGTVVTPRPGEEVIGYEETLVSTTRSATGALAVAWSGPVVTGPAVAGDDGAVLDVFTSSPSGSVEASLGGETVPVEPRAGPTLDMSRLGASGTMTPARLVLPAARFVVSNLTIDDGDDATPPVVRTVTVVPARLDVVADLAGGEPQRAAAADEDAGGTRLVLPDTGDVLVSGVRITGARLAEIRQARVAEAEAARRAAGQQRCRCGDCRLIEITRLDDDSRVIPVGTSARLQVVVEADCPPGCPPTVEGTWHLTFVPWAPTGYPIFLDRGRHVRMPTGTAVAPIEIVEHGAEVVFDPPSPGKLIAHFRGRCRCGEAVCDGPVHAVNREFDISYRSPTAERMLEVLDDVKAKLPDIPVDAKGRAAPSAVAAWFAATTGWRPGTRYSQSIELPADAVSVAWAHIVSTGAQNVEMLWSHDDPMKPGELVIGSDLVFGERQRTRVGISERDGRLFLDYVAPFVDRFYVDVTYLDAEGERHDVDLRCNRTESDGAEVDDPCDAPAVGPIRFVMLDIDPSRMDDGRDLEVSRILAEIAGRFGGDTGYTTVWPAWDEQGRESLFMMKSLHVQICPEMVAAYLEELARAFDADIEVRGSYVILRGSDFGDENLLPPSLGGRRAPWARHDPR